MRLAPILLVLCACAWVSTGDVAHIKATKAKIIGRIAAKAKHHKRGILSAIPPYKLGHDIPVVTHSVLKPLVVSYPPTAAVTAVKVPIPRFPHIGHKLPVSHPHYAARFPHHSKTVLLPKPDHHFHHHHHHVEPRPILPVVHSAPVPVTPLLPVPQPTATIAQPIPAPPPATVIQPTQIVPAPIPHAHPVPVAPAVPSFAQQHFHLRPVLPAAPAQLQPAPVVAPAYSQIPYILRPGNSVQTSYFATYPRYAYNYQTPLVPIAPQTALGPVLFDRPQAPHLHYVPQAGVQDGVVIEPQAPAVPIEHQTFLHQTQIGLPQPNFQVHPGQQEVHLHPGQQEVHLHPGQQEVHLHPGQQEVHLHSGQHEVQLHTAQPAIHLQGQPGLHVPPAQPELHFNPGQPHIHLQPGHPDIHLQPNHPDIHLHQGQQEVHFNIAGQPEVHFQPDQHDIHFQHAHPEVHFQQGQPAAHPGQPELHLQPGYTDVHLHHGQQDVHFQQQPGVQGQTDLNVQPLQPGVLQHAQPGFNFNSVQPGVSFQPAQPDHDGWNPVQTQPHDINQGQQPNAQYPQDGQHQFTQEQGHQVFENHVGEDQYHDYQHQLQNHIQTQIDQAQYEQNYNHQIGQEYGVPQQNFGQSNQDFSQHGQDFNFQHQPSADYGVPQAEGRSSEGADGSEDPQKFHNHIPLGLQPPIDRPLDKFR